MSKLSNLRYFLFICTVFALCGCTHFGGESNAKATFAEANDLFTEGRYAASLSKYAQIIENSPAMEDRALFEMGIIHAHPKNEHRDFPKAVECFETLIKKHPESPYRQNSEMMMFYITTAASKDTAIATQQTEIGALRQDLKSKQDEIDAMQKKMEVLQQEALEFALHRRSVDKILIEKKQRRLMVMSKGAVLKTYKIALGGNPEGPKERQGDNKTPEGTYTIDSRNKDSNYHLSLHISYPNEADKKRAKELGVSPGGEIMIHGLKKGLSWVGPSHTAIDWTKGCIAVTDEEIEEIAKLAPNGTAVEIRP